MKPVRFAMIAAFLTAATIPVFAQSNYPEKSIRLVYGFQAGNDVIERIVAEKLSESLGKPVIIDNVTGAGGNIAADRVAKAAPDGYTIGSLVSASITINASLYKRLPYDPNRDLIPITQIYGLPNVLAVNNDVPARTVVELIEVARARPGEISFGHNGTGTSADSWIIKTNSIRSAGGPHPNIVISRARTAGGRATAGNPRDLL
jgi:tripartite-type tricarboxylate transporter receptor subunit TctC